MELNRELSLLCRLEVKHYVLDVSFGSWQPIGKSPFITSTLTSFYNFHFNFHF